MVWLKRLGLGIAAIVALFVVAIIYVVVFIDPNDFKQELQDVASKQANVTLRLDGDISWSFFPWLGLELADVGVALGSQSELVKFGKVEFGLAIMPLLSQTVQVDRVKIIDLEANLSVDKQGNPNWSNAVTESDVAVEKNVPSTSTDGSQSPSEPLSLPNIQLDQLLVQNAQLQYRDEQNNMLLKTALDLELNNVRWDEAWPMLLNVAVEKSDLSGQEKIQSNITLGANLSIFPEKEAFSLEGLTLKTETKAAFLPVSPLVASVTVKQVDFDIPQENILIENAQLTSMGATVSTSINAYQILSEPVFDGSLELADMNPRALLAKLAIALPEMSDESALTNVSASLAVSGSAKKIQISPLTLNLDQTTLNTTAQVNLDPLYWDISVKGNALDVDRYLPTKSDEVATEVPSGTPAPTSSEVAELLPIELIRQLNGRVSIELENLKVLNLKLDSITAKSTQSNGLVKLEPLNVNLYSGSAMLNANLDARQNTPKISVYPDVKNVQIQPLLNDFMELEKIAGSTFINGNLDLTGNSIESLMGSLSGDLLVEVNDGALVGMNLTKAVCEGIAVTRNESLAKSSFGENTPFERLTFPAHIVDGEISTPGLTIAAVTLKVTGDGVISLPNKSLDYRTNIAFAGSELDNACRVKDTFTKLAFPVVCKGNFSDDPAGLCGPDLVGFGKVFADLAKIELNAKLDAEKARAKVKLEAEKARAEEKLAAEKARAQEKLDAEKVRAQEKLDAEKAKAKAKLKEEEDKAKEKLKNSLKGLFD